MARTVRTATRMLGGCGLTGLLLIGGENRIGVIADVGRENDNVITAPRRRPS